MLQKSYHTSVYQEPGIQSLLLCSLLLILLPTHLPAIYLWGPKAGHLISAYICKDGRKAISTMVLEK
jgi:hypothetical protein